MVHIHYLLQLCYTCLMPYKNHLEMSNHKKVRFLCNQCEFKAAGKGSLKKHSCKYMKVASIYAINVTMKLDRKAISKYMKCYYTRGLSIHVINVATKLYIKVVSKHIKYQFMRESCIYSLS